MTHKRVQSTAERPSSSGEGFEPKLECEAYFNDWKYFCSALREIAGGANGHALPGVAAQKRAQEILSERGYRWWA
jgi:hypothetical protein